MRILFLSSWFPYPPTNGSKLRIYNLLRGLGQQHEVTLLSFTDQPVNGKSPQQLNNICREVYRMPARAYNASSPRALLGLFRSTPRVLVDRYEPEMEQLLYRLVRRERYDLIIASQWYMADYIKPSLGVPALFEEVEVGVFNDKVSLAGNPFLKLRHNLTTLKMGYYLRGLVNRFGACTVVSEKERDLLLQLAPGNHQVEVVPNGVRLRDYAAVPKQPEPDTLVFTGSFSYLPNYEAMLWFTTQVFPLVKSEVPQVRLRITGDAAGQSLPLCEGVSHIGFVPDVHRVVASSSVSLAPIHVGGGTRLKILEAMALRTPVVATTKGAEGLSGVPGRHFLLADSPEEYARSVVRLLRDPDLREYLVENAYQLVREMYDWEVLMPHFLSLVAQVARQPSVISTPLLPKVEDARRQIPYQ